MGKLRNTVLIIGEGPTEFYYLQSLNDLFNGLTIKPDIPKHTNLKELDAKIIEGISLGYQRIYCLIDMDNKTDEPYHSRYEQLKHKYRKPISRPSRGIYCEVSFFETHLCTELFFLYYFGYTSRPFNKQEELLDAINKYCQYSKTEDFFKSCKGLHSYFQKNGGNLDVAIKNANKSLVEKANTARTYTYSELGTMIKRLSGHK